MERSSSSSSRSTEADAMDFLCPLKCPARGAVVGRGRAPPAPPRWASRSPYPVQHAKHNCPFFCAKVTGDKKADQHRSFFSVHFNSHFESGSATMTFFSLNFFLVLTASSFSSSFVYYFCCFFWTFYVFMCFY